MLEKSLIPMSDLRGYLEPQQIQRILREASRRNLRDYVIIRLLWATGCRVSELLGLKLSDIIWEHGCLVMITLKRRNPVNRLVSVDKITMDVLKEYVTKYKIQGRLFDITRQRVFQIFRNVCEHVGIKKIGLKEPHPHHLRHSHCVAWVRKDNTVEGLRKLQERLKHANITTTAHYLQFAVKESREDVEKVFGEW